MLLEKGLNNPAGCSTIRKDYVADNWESLGI
jgi:hypothetical protein